MTLYRLYLRSRIRRELRATGPCDLAPEPARQSCPGRQERPTMVCDDGRYSYSINGSQEFEAENDAVALAIAHTICEAATDLCDAFELWDGTRHVDQHRIVPLRASTIAQHRQDHIVSTEEALLNSDWAIARSRSLLARLKELRDGAPPSATRP